MAKKVFRPGDEEYLRTENCVSMGYPDRIPDYVADLLLSEEKLKFEAHLDECTACYLVVDEIKEAIKGELHPDLSAEDLKEMASNVIERFLQSLK